jgi:hypothetical protein
MRNPSRRWLVFGAVACALASIYGVLWTFSAASLASGFCGFEFSLFAEHLRCRQVHYAMILAGTSAVLCAFLLWRLVRTYRVDAAAR